MNRKKKTVQKRTYSMKGAIPTFVSLVSRGANFTPFAQLRYDETEQFGQDVEIHRVEFSKLVFDTQDKVDTYLNENNFEQYTIEEGANTWVVIGTDAEKFQDLQTIEYEDGVLYHIGKLKEAVAEEAPAAEVITSEEFAEKVEEVAEVIAEAETTEEVVKESEEETKVEETNSEAEEPASEESKAEFTEEKEEVTEQIADDRFEKFMTSEKYSVNTASFREVFDSVRNDRTFIPSFDMLTYAVNDCNYTALRNNDWAQFKQNLNDYFSAVEGMVNATKSLTYSEETVVETEEDKLKVSEEKLAEVLAKYEELAEKVTKIVEKEKETIDEEEVLIQNSQSIQTDDIIEVIENKTDEKAEAFAQKRKNDLFGL